jgi:hypothetical protein
LDANEVRGTLNAVLYGVIFVRELTDDEAQRVAASLAGDDRRERFREAIATALRDGHLPEQTLEFSRPHTEPELLSFLTRVLAHLDTPPPQPTG